MKIYSTENRSAAWLTLLCVLLLLGAIDGDAPLRAIGNGVAKSKYAHWRFYGGGADNLRYSSLDEINRSNVHQLALAWEFDTGDSFPDSEMQCNPLIVHDTLFASTPKLRIIALNAATGKLIWSFDPNPGKKLSHTQRNRGLCYWEQGKDRRLFFVADHYLYAVDAWTGSPLSSFGQSGRIDLRDGLQREPQQISITGTSPGVVYKDLLIMGSVVSEELPSAPGDIRAFDVRTGRLRWSFHTIPHPGEFGYETWPKEAWKYSGGANSWGGASLDMQRGLVFLSTGSAAFDFYGGNRHGDTLFANCILALKAETGERVWHFQTVKHDVWDRDLPAAPSLVTLNRDGHSIDAVAQVTKSGHVFVLERATGAPLFPIENRRVPPSDVEGELLAETQPFPLKPPPFARQTFSEDLVTERTPAAHANVLQRLRQVRSSGQCTPPSLQGTVVFPGFDGGGEWGGGSFDPDTGVFYVNSNEMAWILRLVPRPFSRDKATSRELHLRHCAGCHREDLLGSPPTFPSLKEAGQNLPENEISTIIRSGRGRMPEFAWVGDEVIAAIAHYLKSGDGDVVLDPPQHPPAFHVGYTMDGYNKFLDPDGYPAMKPPWGTLSAIDLNRGEIKWSIPFGEYPELVKAGMGNTGSENYGGSVVTAGGLLFIGATNMDRKFRAFDKENGKLLWQTTLPAAGNATPAVYEVGGRQFVVIAAGGGKWGNPSGGSYRAFALPR